MWFPLHRNMRPLPARISREVPRSAGCITIPFYSWGHEVITRGSGLSRSQLVSDALWPYPLSTCWSLHITATYHSSVLGSSTVHIRRTGEPQWDTTSHSGGSDSKESACRGDLGSLPALGRSPREGNGYPLQCSCLENSMDWGAWWATVHWVT